MIFGILSLIESFVFELFTDQSTTLFGVVIIPYINLPTTVVDQGQPSHVDDSSPFRLIMSSKDPLLPDDDPGPTGPPVPPTLPGPPPPPGPPPDVSNEILISRVADISRERTIDIKYGMNLS